MSLPKGAVGPRATRVLLAVIRTHATEGRATVRGVTFAAGYKSTGDVYETLCELRRQGLVAWDPGTRGTLRPLVGPVRHG